MIGNLLKVALLSVFSFDTPSLKNEEFFQGGTMSGQDVIETQSYTDIRNPTTPYPLTNTHFLTYKKTLNGSDIQICQVDNVCRTLVNGQPTVQLQNGQPTTMGIIIYSITNLVSPSTKQLNVEGYISSLLSDYELTTPTVYTNSYIVNPYYTNELNDLLESENPIEELNTTNNYNYGQLLWHTIFVQNTNALTEYKSDTTKTDDYYVVNLDYYQDMPVTQDKFYLVTSITFTDVANNNNLPVDYTNYTWRLFDSDPNYEYGILGNTITGNINYEVVDIPGLCMSILTMPFTFISTAFNVTLFPGTPYQLNISWLFLSIFAILVFVFIIKKFVGR